MRLIASLARQERADGGENRIHLKPEQEEQFESYRRTARSLLRQLDATLGRRPAVDDPPILRCLQVVERNGANVPDWDPGSRKLWYRGKLCRRFKKVAPAQMALIAAFEEKGWPRRLELPSLAHRLPDTLANMKPDMKVIRFHRDGDGIAVCWKPIRS